MQLESGLADLASPASDAPSSCTLTRRGRTTPTNTTTTDHVGARHGSPASPLRHGEAGPGPTIRQHSRSNILATAVFLGISTIVTFAAPTDAPYLTPLYSFTAILFLVAGSAGLAWPWLKSPLDAIPRHQRPAIIIPLLLAPLALAHAMHAWTRLSGWSLIFYVWILILCASLILAIHKHWEVHA